jgi:hypothetical protein
LLNNNNYYEYNIIIPFKMHTEKYFTTRFCNIAYMKELVNRG